MRKPSIVSRLLAVLLLAALFVAGCTSVSEDTKPENTEPVLEVVGLDDTVVLTMADLQDLPITEGLGGTKSSAGVITPPQQIKGVEVETLAELVGGLVPGMGVSIVAKDGYAMTMSYEQIVGGDYITYDPGTGNENEIENPLKTIVAYERDGQPIPSEEDGPLRLFIVSEKNDNVIDGHWTVKWVTKIELKPMSEEWSLYLEGVSTEEMDRNSFESCSAPGCHQAVWTDTDGNEWMGVPLYYLAGRVDGGNIHENRAYDDDFAKAGYILQFFSADGDNVGIDSSRTIFNRELFVASVVNGEPLYESHFPLRLVGAGLDESEMIGQLAQIVIKPKDGIDMPSAQADTGSDLDVSIADIELPEGAVLMVLGKVLNQLTLGMGNLQAMNVIELETEHPKKGMQSYSGVVIKDLLNLSGVGAEASIVVMTASDGYAVELSLADVLACEDCILAFSEDNTLNAVMPGMDSEFWAKAVTFLEVK